MPPPVERGWPTFVDVRLVGFAALTPLAEAEAWIDARTAAPLAGELVRVEAARGRVLEAAAVAPQPVPAVAVAAYDGVALAAEATLAASPYDPLVLAPSQAPVVAPGDPLPPGADSVLAFGSAVLGKDGRVEAQDPIFPGQGVVRAGQALGGGAVAAAAGRALGPLDLAALRAAGIARVAVRRRPAVRLVIPGPRRGAGPELLEGLLRELVEADGGVVTGVARRPTVLGAIREALLDDEGPADLVILAGRSASGAEDVGAPALAAAGEVALHGVAIRPGASSGVGAAGGRTVLLLPGEPLACAVAYRLLAARAVRRLAGRPPAPPRLTAGVGRRIASEVGLTEACPVRLEDGLLVPLRVSEGAMLAVAATADGFVLVPSGREGFAPGAVVPVHDLGLGEAGAGS